MPTSLRCVGIGQLSVGLIPTALWRWLFSRLAGRRVSATVEAFSGSWSRAFLYDDIVDSFLGTARRREFRVEFRDRRPGRGQQVGGGEPSPGVSVHGGS